MICVVGFALLSKQCCYRKLSRPPFCPLGENGVCWSLIPKLVRSFRIQEGVDRGPQATAAWIKAAGARDLPADQPGLVRSDKCPSVCDPGVGPRREETSLALPRAPQNRVQARRTNGRATAEGRLEEAS